MIMKLLLGFIWNLAMLVLFFALTIINFKRGGYYDILGVVCVAIGGYYVDKIEKLLR